MAIIRIYFELLSLIPMPFQVAVFLLITSLCIYWTVRILAKTMGIVGQVGMKISIWFTQLLLLPEFLYTNLLRLAGIKYIPGSGIYDDIVEAIGGFFYKIFESLEKIKNKEVKFPGGLVWLSIIGIIIIWYLSFSSEMQGTLTAQYIHSFFGWYYEFQYKALSYQAP